MTKPLMEIHMGEGVKQLLDVEALTAELKAQEIDLVTISKHGELVIDDNCHGVHYPYRREVWQMRNEGEGANNQTWAEHEWEFCRSICME